MISRLTSELNDINGRITDKLKSITGEYASVSDREGVIRAKFSYVRRELDNEVWDNALNFLIGEGYVILDGTDNHYEENYEREEPAEAVPTIYFRENKHESVD